MSHDLFSSLGADGGVPDATPTPNFVNLSSQAYDRYEVNTDYVEMSGSLPLPLAGADPSACRVVRLHAPYTVKIVRWSIEAICPVGVKPKPPHWNTFDDAETLIFKNVRMQAPTITPGGNGLVWRISGEYRYARTSASTEFPAGATPVSVLAAGNFVLEESDFSEDVLTTKGGPLNAIPVPQDFKKRATLTPKTSDDTPNTGKELAPKPGSPPAGNFKGDVCSHS